MSAVSAFQTLRKFQSLGEGVDFVANDINTDLEHTYLLFLIAEKLYALPSGDIADIRDISSDVEGLMSIPYSPDWVTGMVAVKNKPIVLLDAAQMLDIDKGVANRKKMLVLRNEDLNIALLVDQVLGLRTVEQNQIAKTFEKNTPYEIRNQDQANSNYRILEIQELLMSLNGV